MAQHTRTQRWQNRIVGSGTLKVADALFNPLNWRVHPKIQQDALEGVLEEVGWVQQVIVNKVTGHLVDGHARVLLADKHGEPDVPCLFVELTEDEERLVLATLDPISALATTSAETLAELLEDVHSGSKAVQELIASIAERAGLYDAPAQTPPEDFDGYDDDLPTEHKCPRCGYEWSGKA
jgi:hypothetical protein